MSKRNFEYYIQNQIKTTSSSALVITKSNTKSIYNESPHVTGDQSEDIPLIDNIIHESDNNNIPLIATVSDTFNVFGSNFNVNNDDKKPKLVDNLKNLISK